MLGLEIFRLIVFFIYYECGSRCVIFLQYVLFNVFVLRYDQFDLAIICKTRGKVLS